MTALDTHTAPAPPVEIRDWARALGRRLWLIVIVALAAGALAGVLALGQGQQYRSSTSVVIPHPQTLGSVAIAVSQTISDFQGLLGSSTLASLTARAAKLRAGYQEANDRITAASQAYATAQQAQIEAQGELTAAQNVELTATPPVGLSRATYAAKRVIPAMIFGLAMGVGIVVLLELLRPASRARRA